MTVTGRRAPESFGLKAPRGRRTPRPGGPRAQLGDPVEVRVESFGGKRFTGTISRFTHRINEQTRTIMAEIEVPNPNLELMPGMYAQALLKAKDGRAH
jgi:membrane fusion protein, copper/silver efflux system